MIVYSLKITNLSAMLFLYLLYLNFQFISENGTGNELILTFSRDREYAYQEISMEEHRKEIEDIFSKTIGKKIQLIVKLDEGSGSFQKTHHSVEDFMNVFGKAGITVENEEE